MGFAASAGRLQMLVGRKTDLELKLQMIQQQRMYWADVATRLMMAAARNPGAFEPGQPAAIQLEARRAQIGQIDKMLEMEANRITQQRDACVTEIEAVNKVISKNIEMSFGLMGRG